MIRASHVLQVADMLTARGALAAAHAGTRLPGSSTACVLRLNRVHGTVDTANLGEPVSSLGDIGTALH